MFSELSKNWAGVPLTSFETIIGYAETTTTKTGLQIAAIRDQRLYNKGVKISDRTMGTLDLTRDKELAEWNYTIRSRGTLPPEQISPTLSDQDTASNRHATRIENGRTADQAPKPEAAAVNPARVARASLAPQSTPTSPNRRSGGQPGSVSKTSYMPDKLIGVARSLFRNVAI